MPGLSCLVSQSCPAARQLLIVVVMRIAIGLVVMACLVAGGGTARAEAKRSAGVFVTLMQVTDQAERAAHIDAIKAKLAACPLLANRVVDVNITRLAYVTVGNNVELQLELGFVLSNTNSEIVSVANQTAKLVLPAAKFKVKQLPELRRDVLDTAIGDLIIKLRKASVTRNV